MPKGGRKGDHKGWMRQYTSPVEIDAQIKAENEKQKCTGVEGLVDIENPNRLAQSSKKVTQIDLEGPRKFSRREREEIEKQKAKADLARQAIMQKQREEAAKKKEEEQKFKDATVAMAKGVQSMSLNK
ncbi:hypothetical protein XELAEV_18024387mg [Xenopus laevis]|uniref:Casein kinase substrate phosphoprotein PP28 domain-containing protein n=1 Tax=Xenopus laevis TaxID=8355 RepID=A0A974CZZ1_XENLA|nr:hypothetical protein XELAEV_18024387mg [Xenopus laevis]